MKRVVTVGLRPNILMKYEIEKIGGYSSLFPAKYREMVIGHGTIRDKYPNLLIGSAANENILEMLNVKYALTKPGRAPPWPNARRIYSGDVDIFLAPDYAKRAYISYDYRVFKGETAMMEFMKSPGFDPGKMVLLWKEPQIKVGPDGFGTGTTGSSKVEITSYENESVSMEVETDRNGILVLADQNYPGWIASVDGQERKIIDANYVLKGLEIEKGRHRVEFEYRPNTFRVGAVISFLTLFLCACAVVIERRRSIK